MTKLEFINKVIARQEKRTIEYEHGINCQCLGTCSSFNYEYMNLPINSFYQIFSIEKEFKELFKDNDYVYWLSSCEFDTKQNNLNRLTCLYLYREMIKGESK